MLVVAAGIETAAGVQVRARRCRHGAFGQLNERSELTSVDRQSEDLIAVNDSADCRVGLQEGRWRFDVDNFAERARLQNRFNAGVISNAELNSFMDFLLESGAFEFDLVDVRWKIGYGIETGLIRRDGAGNPGCRLNCGDGDAGN